MFWILEYFDSLGVKSLLCKNKAKIKRIDKVYAISSICGPHPINNKASLTCACEAVPGISSITGTCVTPRSIGADRVHITVICTATFINICNNCR